MSNLFRFSGLPGTWASIPHPGIQCRRNLATLGGSMICIAEKYLTHVREKQNSFLLPRGDSKNFLLPSPNQYQYKYLTHVRENEKWNLLPRGRVGRRALPKPPISTKNILVPKHTKGTI